MFKSLCLRICFWQANSFPKVISISSLGFGKQHQKAFAGAFCELCVSQQYKNKKTLSERNEYVHGSLARWSCLWE